MKSNRLLQTILTLILCLAFSSLASAQVNEEWVQIYDSPGGDDDEANAMTVDDVGNIYVAGYETDVDGYDRWLTIKYDTDGVEQWSATHSGTGGDDDYIYAIAVDGTGNVYVTGSTYNSGTSSDFATIKYNSSGVEQWVAGYNGSLNRSDTAKDIAVDGSGNVFVTGQTETPGGDQDCVTIRYDASGTEQWVNVYDGTGDGRDYGVALVVDGSSNVFVTGITENAAGNRDGMTIMYDLSGVEQWVSAYDGDFHGSDSANDITLDGLGNVVITGSTSVAINDFECLTIKYNSSGVEQWVRSYRGVEDEGAGGNCITSDGLGNTYVGGDTDSEVTGRDFCTIKYDSNGVAQWVATYNGPADGHEDVVAIVVDELGNVYVTGDVDTPNSDHDYATIMYNSLGEEQWAVSYNSDADDYDRPYALAVDGSGNVFVTGYSYDATGYVNWATVKYGPDETAVDDQGAPAPVRPLVAAPNPFNPTTEIRFTLEASAHAILSVHDSSGRLIRVLRDATLPAGRHLQSWDGRNDRGDALPSGIYLARLVENGKPTAVGKLTLCK
ncbi:MAG: hypothetical protein GY835_00605 [bacterium]|nr:hypothetical protein [bacterium]